MTCERCWDAAFWEAAMLGGSQADYYREIVQRRDALGIKCSPQEQAGQFWDAERGCDSRERQAKEGR